MTFNGYQQKKKLQNKPEISTGRSKTTNTTDVEQAPKVALDAIG